MHDSSPLPSTIKPEKDERLIDPSEKTEEEASNLPEATTAALDGQRKSH